MYTRILKVASFSMALRDLRNLWRQDHVHEQPKERAVHETIAMVPISYLDVFKSKIIKGWITSSFINFIKYGCLSGVSATEPFLDGQQPMGLPHSLAKLSRGSVSRMSCIETHNLSILILESKYPTGMALNHTLPDEVRCGFICSLVRLLQPRLSVPRAQHTLQHVK